MARRFWLVKSDPETLGWNDLAKAKGRKTVWDGVRNYQARNTLRDDVKRGDGAWTAVEIALEETLAKPVTLDAMHAVPGLSKMALLQRGSRLSVQPVTEAEWEIVLRMGRA